MKGDGRSFGGCVAVCWGTGVGVGSADASDDCAAVVDVVLINKKSNVINDDINLVVKQTRRKWSTGLPGSLIN